MRMMMAVKSAVSTICWFWVLDFIFTSCSRSFDFRCNCGERIRCCAFIGGRIRIKVAPCKSQVPDRAILFSMKTFIFTADYRSIKKLKTQDIFQFFGVNSPKTLPLVFLCTKKGVIKLLILHPNFLLLRP